MQLNNQYPGQVIGTSEILRLTEINHEHELKDQLLMASFGKIKQCVQLHLKAILKNPNLPPIKIHEKSKEIKNLIGELVFDSPYEQFGRFPEMMLTEKYFSKVIQQTLMQVSTVITDKSLNPKAPTGRQLEEQLWNCIDIRLLPMELSSTSQNAPEQLVEKQSQQEVQQERMAMVQKELMNDTEPELRGGAIHWNWESNLNTFDRSFYHIATVEELQDIPLPKMNTRTKPWLPSSYGQAPFLSVADIFKNEPELAEFADVFDIEVSYNFLPVEGTAFKAGNFISIHQKPFQKSQLLANNMLICQDLETDTIQLRIISQTDAGFFFRKMMDENTPDSKKQVITNLYRRNLGGIQCNAKPIYIPHNSNLDKKTLTKIVQAKFFNGEVIYTKTEFEVLTEWIEENGPERMERLFTQHIIIHKTDRKSEYPNSSLYKIFQHSKKSTVKIRFHSDD